MIKLMKLRLFFLISLILTLLVAIFPSTARAWAGEAHQYMCPPDLLFSCTEADHPDFKRKYPFAENFNHLCFDNKPDCLARLVAKYYLKKYFVEGEKDPKLVGGAAHFLQDAACPDHWYPMREYFGRIFVPFAPSWVGKTEGLVDRYLKSGEVDWNLPRKFQGKTININAAYLDAQKEQIQNLIAQEPQENLGDLEAQIKSKNTWAWLRSVKEMVMLAAVILLPAWGYVALKWKRKKEGLSDLVIISLILALFIFVVIASQLFY